MMGRSSESVPWLIRCVLSLAVVLTLSDLVVEFPTLDGLSDDLFEMSGEWEYSEFCSKIVGYYGPEDVPLYSFDPVTFMQLQIQFCVEIEHGGDCYSQPYASPMFFADALETDFGYGSYSIVFRTFGNMSGIMWAFYLEDDSYESLVQVMGLEGTSSLEFNAGNEGFFVDEFIDGFGQFDYSRFGTFSASSETAEIADIRSSLVSDTSWSEVGFVWKETEIEVFVNGELVYAYSGPSVPPHDPVARRKALYFDFLPNCPGEADPYGCGPIGPDSVPKSVFLRSFRYHAGAEEYVPWMVRDDGNGGGGDCVRVRVWLLREEECG